MATHSSVLAWRILGTGQPGGLPSMGRTESDTTEATQQQQQLCAVLSYVQLFATPWPVACQAPLSMGFSRQEYWSGLPCPPPGDLSNLGIEPVSLLSPALAGRFFTTSATQEALAPIFILIQIISLLSLSPRHCQIFNIIQLTFICFWLHWVFIVAYRLSLVEDSEGYSSCRSQALSEQALVVAAHRFQSAGSAVVTEWALLPLGMWNLPDHGLNPCPPHWQMNY